MLYLGAHGISQGLGTVLDAAARTKYRKDIVYLLVGDSAEKSALQERAVSEDLDNVRFLPPIPKEDVPRYYRSADACLVPLRDLPLFERTIPSKLFELLTCGRPVIGCLRGEAAGIRRDSGGGVVVPPEDPDALATAVRTLADAPKRGGRLARNGPGFIRKNYD